MTDELRSDGTLHLERDYDATPDDVWDAWTDPDRLARWLAVPAGPLGATPTRLTFGDGGDDWADVTVRIADRPRELELRWEFAGEVASTLRVTIDALPDGRSRLIVEHRDLGDSTAGYGAGWDAYLGDLGAVLGARVDGTWDQRFASAYPTWQERLSG